MRMTKMAVAMVLVMVAGGAKAGESLPMVIDLRTERESGGDETLPYSSLWDGGDGATVTIAQDGEAIEGAVGLTGEGELAWSVPYNGTYKLTHITCANGETGKVETATFIVTGKVDPPAVVSFDEAAYSADEGGTLEVVVKGGNATMPSRVAVSLSYLTAAAADLDLKNGAIDGVTPKGGLKFPLLLTWDAGDKAPKTISIPVKADKTVEGYESLVLQLAELVGMGPGETVSAWATIADRNDKTLKPTVSPYKPKKGEIVATNQVTVGVSPSDLGFAAGSGAYTVGTKLTMVAEARPGCAFVGWERGGSIESDKPKYQIVVSNDVTYTAKFAAVDYMCGLADPADGGKVTGSDYCPAGKKVTLKAAANKGFAFVGWATNNAARPESAPYPDGYFVATTASLVIDRTAKPAKDSKTSTTISNLTESTTFYAVFTGDPLVSAIPVLDDGVVSNEAGKVTGAGRYAPGKKVTLKATANKGFAFSGFFDAEGNLLDETRSASLSFEMGDKDVPLTARFVTVDADKGSIAANVDGWELEPWVSKTETHAFATNVWAGVSLAWPLAASALSQTTVKVAGLPAGLKFTAKDILKKGSKTEVDIPANTIYGAPTAASKTGKDGNPVPSTVKVTVTTAGKSSATYEIALTVDPLPEWAVGTFDGEAYAGDSDKASGLVQAFTVAANGKISGKILEGGNTWTLSAGEFSRVERVEHVEDGVVFHATVIAKAGKLLETNEVTVAATNGVGVVTGAAAAWGHAALPDDGGLAALPEWSAYQNLWKRSDMKAAQPVIKKDIKIDHWLGEEGNANDKLTLTFKKDGVVAFAGKIGGTKVSGSSQLVWGGGRGATALPDYGHAGRVPLPDGWYMTVYAPPKATAKPPFDGFCATLAVTLTLDTQKVVTKVELGRGKVQLWEGGPYWATTNIGAEKPEDYGYYFWWGDTVGYKRENEQWVASDGSSRGFSFSEANTPTMGKDYSTLYSEGWITSEGALAPGHDAAHVKWGCGWRMPTEQELSDLTNRCDWTWMTLNDVNGYEVRGRGGYASASIFLPASGAGNLTSLNNVGSYGAYFSSVPELEYCNVWYIGFSSTDYNMANYGNRRIGFAIRPVQSPAE